MRVAISRIHLRLNEKLAREINHLTRNFSNKDYSRIESIENILLKQDISVEKKKRWLMRRLHDGIVKAFSINKNKFNTKTFHSLKKRLRNLRRITIKLRSINYYLETAFLEDLEVLKFKVSEKSPKISQQDDLARNELEALEYMAYKLIEKVVVLDKRLLREFAHKARNLSASEEVKLKSLRNVLRKGSTLLEHIEAKLPPPKSMTMSLAKEPVFTHWVSRVLALLSHLENLYGIEAKIFSKLKKNKSAKVKINKKILHLIKEQSRLVRIMEEKATSIKKFRLDKDLKKELHNFKTTINL